MRLKPVFVFPLLLILLTALTVSQPAHGAESKVTIKIADCKTCAQKVRVGVILENVDGVTGADYDARKEVFVVSFDDKVTNVDSILKALIEGGFHVRGRPTPVK
ncbi:MAG TPA: hypothetical protein VFG29_03215 [Syntrophales bacterium]|nr:hypothetical protein [Syntrophales bacterium]